ncbi:MAG: type II toxin-antitoxin system prevent-host-death family antitoxin [Clostridiales bacterium]|nr:type II toxin-antitoxin system prevent-host-death family antitoxin [Clostridiales bacterium]
MKATATEVKNNLGRYLRFIEYEDVVISSHGKNIAVLSKYVDETIHVEEETAIYKTGKWVSYEEFLILTRESDERYELIDGQIYVMDSPLFPHQKALMNIVASFSKWFEGKKCFPIVAPFDVTLIKNKNNICIVQPDILVICDKETINEKGKYKGTPTLVVEILSKSSRGKDMVTKLNLYAETGVKEFWIVDTDKKQIMMYSFKNCQLDKHKTYEDGEIDSQFFEGLTLNLSDIFI